MGLSINQNIMAMNSYRNLSATQTSLSKSLEKLSSGFRINRAADDAAGLAISEGLRSQVGGNKQAVRNAQDGISVVQTAEGALHEVHSILQRMRDLCTQGANDSNDSKARGNIATELNNLTQELDRIAKVTNFNGAKLLCGDLKGLKPDGTGLGGGTKLNFQVGANGTADDKIVVDLANANIITVASKLNFKTLKDDGSGFENTANPVKAGTAAPTFLSVESNAESQKAITEIDKQIAYVSTARSNLGAVQNRFEHTISNLNVAVENLSASESRIRDTDMAQEMMQFTRNQILSQAGTAMLAQANQVPQGVLSLLR